MKVTIQYNQTLKAYKVTVDKFIKPVTISEKLLLSIKRDGKLAFEVHVAGRDYDVPVKP